MIARFDAFDLDTTNCRLSHNGQTIRLAKQPLDLLVLLVTRRDELVTREEIAKTLWTSTFVDSEHSINSAIRKIRTALDDDPAAARNTH